MFCVLQAQQANQCAVYQRHSYKDVNMLHRDQPVRIISTWKVGRLKWEVTEGKHVKVRSQQPLLHHSNHCTSNQALFLAELRCCSQSFSLKSIRKQLPILRCHAQGKFNPFLMSQVGYPQMQGQLQASPRAYLRDIKYNTKIL